MIGCVGMVGPVDQAAFSVPDEFAFDSYDVALLDGNIWCHFRIVCHQNCRAIGEEQQEFLVRQSAIVILEHFFDLRGHSQGHFYKLQLLGANSLGVWSR